MKISPQTLKREFEELFKEQQEVENTEDFKNKRKKYDNINLEIKHDLSTLSEIFQDPDLMSKISEEAHTLMKVSADRQSRIRQELDLITMKKPQAKDVNTSRKVEDELESMYGMLEKTINKEKEFINPLTPKKRKYLNETDSTSSGQKEMLSAFNASSQSDETAQNQQPEKSELDVMFDETSKLISESHLKTVGSKYLYTLLPRQTDPNAFIYVKEDYNPAEKDGKKGDHTSALDDTVITVLIFNPANPNLKFQQIEILGSQTISDIRDAIYCQSDFSHHHHHKNSDPEGEVLNTPQKKTSPAFMYMDHTFYLDTRHREFTVDYYDELIDTWMTKKHVNRGTFQFTKKIMHRSVLHSIQFELHRPFAFVHQTTCEHVMMIKDIRLISPKEYKSKEEFPRTTHNLRYDRFKCSMCTIYPATKVTYDDITSGFSPCYFCDICFESFHQDTSNIQVFEYNGTPGGEIKKRKAFYQKSNP